MGIRNQNKLSKENWMSDRRNSLFMKNELFKKINHRTVESHSEIKNITAAASQM